MKRNLPKIIGLILILGALITAYNFLPPLPVYQWQQKRMVNRVLSANPEELLQAGRLMLQQHPGFVGYLDPSSSEIPAAIRKLGPTRISFRTNHVAVDFSDVFNPFGIFVYSPGENGEGQGRHEWINGLWLYDDGQLHDVVFPKLAEH